METIKKLGILGGSFDPIHRAHLMLAEEALSQCGLEQVWFMPSGISYHKGREMTPTEHRVAMVQLAIDGNPNFAFSDLDISREGNTYTADTLRILHERMPDAELYFLVGADSLMNMENWYRPEVIFEHAVILAARRPGSNDRVLSEKQEELKRRFHARIRILDCMYADISSSQIREALASGDSTEEMLPETVFRYIREHGLYEDRKPMTAAEILEDLKTRLKESRYRHTIGVAETARELALRWGEDPDRAYLAGVLHDCAKYLSGEEELRRAHMAGIGLTPCEEACPALIHAKLGAYYAKERYHITDPEVLDAIRYHTTGRPAMTLLESILFVADYVEPGRTEAPHLEEFRALAFQDLPQTIYRIAGDTLAYLEKKGSVIDDMSRRTCEFYQKTAAKGDNE